MFKAVLLITILPLLSCASSCAHTPEPGAKKVQYTTEIETQNAHCKVRIEAHKDILCVHTTCLANLPHEIRQIQSMSCESHGSKTKIIPVR